MTSAIIYTTAFFLTVTTLVFIRNRFEFRSMSSFSENTFRFHKISVCIPARNEEKVIERCVRSCLSQTHPEFEVLVLDDRSEDRTGQILRSLQNESGASHLHILNGTDRPESWLGKPWACQQLSQAATGQVLVFIDADTWLEADFLRQVDSEMQKGIDALTVWPRQHLETFWEKVVVPQVYYALLTLLPAIYVRRFPRWMPAFVRPLFKNAFSAACGQCIAFKREAYEVIGGHAAVKNQVVEDVELARALKTNDKTIAMFHGVGSINCRMYQSENEIFEGFRKNFLAGFGNNLFFFSASALLHLIVFVMPILLLSFSLFTSEFRLLMISAGLLIWPILLRVALDSWNGWNLRYSLLHSLGVLWFQRLGVTVIVDKLSGRKVKWKGRGV